MKYLGLQFSKKTSVLEFKSGQSKKVNGHCPYVSTAPITAMGYWQCLSLSVVQLKGKHWQNPHCRNWVVIRSGIVVQVYKPHAVFECQI